MGFAPTCREPQGRAIGMLELFHAACQKNGRKKHFDSLRGVGSMRRALYEPEASKL